MRKAISSTEEEKGMKMNQSGTRVLVIDDDPDFRKVISLILESKSYDVVTAKDPQEARKKLLTQKPDLILLDIMMDSIFDGYSLCHDIKTSKEYQEFRDTPIIFISAVKEKAGSRLSFDSSEQGLVGPDDYIDKPVQPEDLFIRIEKLLKK
jgi:CheY-like chemotaxis protein